MRRAVSCIEALERRTLLDAAIEVWAGNTDLSGSWDLGNTILSIDQQGYTRIGESNAANASISFSGGNYKYFVVVTRDRVQIDSIRASSGSYISLSEMVHYANVDNANSVTGASNSNFATFGTTVNDQTYAGAMLLAAPSSWSGITIKTGTVQPLFEVSINFEAYFMQGATNPYGFNGEVELRHQGMISSASVHTPAGRWLPLVSEEHDNELQTPEKYFSTKAQMEAEFGDGTYTINVSHPTGTKSYTFSQTGLAFPTQIPSTTSFTHGRTDTPTTRYVALPAITDPSIRHVALHVDDSQEDEVYSEYTTGPSWSLPTVALSPGESYSASLQFGSGNFVTTSQGIKFGYSKTSNLELIFATTGFVQGTPDLQGSFSASATTINPGDILTLDFAVGVTGGIAIASGPTPKQPVTHKVGLSMNQTIGDADDVLLFYSVEPGETNNWGFEGQMMTQVPQTAVPGQYYVFGAMDAANVVAESNESNNTTWSATPIITIAAQPIVLDPATKRLSISGTAGADIIKVTVDAQTVHASIGATTRSFAKSSITSVYVNGGAGNDKITVGNGMSAVSLYGGEGNDSIYAGSGNDVIYGNGGDDRLFGQDGADSIFAGLGADSLDGGNHNDSLIGGDHSDTIIGGAGNDYIEGKGKADTLKGGLGNDTLVGGAGSNMIYGDDGDDKIYAANGTGFCDTIYGGAGTDARQSDPNDILTSVEQSILGIA